MSEQNKFVFGIDLGTTYSCIAYVDENGMPTVVKNMEGDNTTPSVVFFEDENNVTVGQVAKENAVIEPQKTVSFVKEHMGKDDFDFAPYGQKISPEEVSSHILRKVTKDAAEQLGTEVKDVVITCPAYFGTAECLATKHAGEIAGLNVLAIIREPAAAALSYLTRQQGSDKTVLVYDLGGGTFDVTVMKIASDGRAEIVCYEGDQALGGQHWDKAVVDYLKDEFQEQHSDMQEDDWLPEDLQELRNKAEKAKKELSGRGQTKVTLNVAGRRAQIELTREIFDSLTQSLLNRSIDCTDRAIAMAMAKKQGTGANEGVEDAVFNRTLEQVRNDSKTAAKTVIDEILLVGGSTRMPQVATALTERYDIPQQILDPDEAVAKGAAISALAEYEGRVEHWQEQQKNGTFDMQDEEIKEEAAKYQTAATVKTTSIPGFKNNKVSIRQAVTMASTKSYALKVVVNHEEEKCQNLIIKNAKMKNGEIVVTQRFGTDEANQMNAQIMVYESDMSVEYYDVNEIENGNADELGTVTLELPGNLPADSPLDVTFKLTKEGILEVTAKDVTNGGELFVTMQATAGSMLSAEEVKKLKEKSQRIAVV
ncbi:Hsp70 family protein [Selenomonas sp. AE3005]|uniref:Hsp70 family protein n=1 Tax=Selenomonas sp. AE3005 TaxID=1485543 RepID=UPI000489E44B|nr:Hsp70 family protein [Selenomonas sp. AE3005]